MSWSHCAVSSLMHVKHEKTTSCDHQLFENLMAHLLNFLEYQLVGALTFLELKLFLVAGIVAIQGGKTPIDQWGTITMIGKMMGTTMIGKKFSGEIC